MGLIENKKLLSLMIFMGIISFSPIKSLAEDQIMPIPSPGFSPGTHPSPDLSPGIYLSSETYPSSNIMTRRINQNSRKIRTLFRIIEELQEQVANHKHSREETAISVDNSDSPDDPRPPGSLNIAIPEGATR